VEVPDVTFPVGSIMILFVEVPDVTFPVGSIMIDKSVKIIDAIIPILLFFVNANMGQILCVLITFYK
jgi:hypothetical protein